MYVKSAQYIQQRLQNEGAIALANETQTGRCNGTTSCLFQVVYRDSRNVSRVRSRVPEYLLQQCSYPVTNRKSDCGCYKLSDTGTRAGNCIALTKGNLRLYLAEQGRNRATYSTPCATSSAQPRSVPVVGGRLVGAVGSSVRWRMVSATAASSLFQNLGLALKAVTGSSYRERQTTRIFSLCLSSAGLHGRIVGNARFEPLVRD